MSFVLVFVLVVASLIIHEIAHGIAMQKNGIVIQEMSLGLFKKIGLGPFRHPKIFGGASLYVTPLLLGAYVAPYPAEGKKLEKMPLSKRLDVYCAGPGSNLLFSSLLFFIYEAIVFGQTAPTAVGLVGIFTLILIWFTYNQYLRKFLNYVVMPLIGLVLVAIIISGLFSTPTETVGGPIMMVSETKQSVTSVARAILMGALLSFSIGIFNLLPLFPLDGGRIIRAYLERLNLFKVAEGFSVVSGVFFFVLIIWAFGCDILRAIGIIH